MDRKFHAFQWGWDCTPQVALAGVHAVTPHEVDIWIDVFPVDRTPVPRMLPAQDSPDGLLVLMFAKLRFVVPLDGRASTLMPPHGVPPVVCPGPFPLTVMFLISKAAPLRRMPPPGLLITAQVSM